MNLRKLKQEDAPFMLEWMHDESVVKNLQANFFEKTIDDCEKFIEASKNVQDDMHLAIVDENDVYMGTVSLKNITNVDAEFAITIRNIAMGKGYSKYAMEEIIRIGLEELGLERVFWCVSPDNKRAVRFYDKNKYERIHVEKESKIRGYTADQIEKYLWYAVKKELLHD